MRGAGMRKHLKEDKDMINTESLRLIHRRRKETKNDKLETPDHLHDNHRVRTLIEKNEETSHE